MRVVACILAFALLSTTFLVAPATGSAALPDGLVAWWKGEDSFEDETGAHDGTPVRAVTFADGLVGRAFAFDNPCLAPPCDSSHVVVPHADALSFGPGEAYTIEFWAYETGGRNAYHLLGKRNGCSGDPNEFNYQTGDHDGWFFTHRGSGIRVPSGDWVHLAGTYDGTAFRMYMDGTLVSSGAAHVPPENTAALLLGGSGLCAGFQGFLDEIAIYDRALTDDEIRGIAEAGDAGKVPDSDGDGHFDGADNCLGVPNADQSDLDGDGVGDVCDDDVDGDGLTNADEKTHGTNARDADSDDDGLSDGDEVHAHGADPRDADTDGDAQGDGFEVDHGSDPTSWWSFWTPILIVDVEDETGTEPPGGRGGGPAPLPILTKASA